METHISLPTAEPPKCDFCSGRPVVACFIASDAKLEFELVDGEPTGAFKRITLNSSSHWGACEECAAIVRTWDPEDKEGKAQEAMYQRCYDRAPEVIRNSASGVASLYLIQDQMFWSVFRGVEHGMDEVHQ